MVEKLDLPFPLLSDPDGRGAIKPYGVWHEERGVARPAVVVVGIDGEEAFRQVSREFSDRITEDDLVERVLALDLPPVKQDPPAIGRPEAGERAFPLTSLAPYFRGVKFATIALRVRVPQAEEEAAALEAEAERYIESGRRRLEA